jgi:hypothetical protein
MTGTYRHALAWLRADWDRAAGIALIVAGGIALFVGYQGVADSAFVVEALSYIASGGLVGVLLVAGGLTLLLSADLHDEWRKLDRIEAAIRSLSAESEIVLPPPETDSNGAAEASRRWRRRSVGAFGLLAIACGGALLLAWDGVASAAEPGDAVQSAAGASSAVVLYGVIAAAFLVLQRSRNIARRRRLLVPFGGLPATGTSPTGPADTGQVYVVPGLERYHRPGCAALAGVATQGVAADTPPAGLRPCGLCHSQ